MNQTWENGKKANFKNNFGQIGPNLGPKILLCGFSFYLMLDIVRSYHYIQVQGKLLISKLKNMAKNLILRLQPIGPKFEPP